MLSLVMDTSNQYLLVALFENGELLESIVELGSKKQSENAIPYLEKVLKSIEGNVLNTTGSNNALKIDSLWRRI